MRRASFLLLFLLVGSLLAAAPVRAETAYYALSFDGDDYVKVADSADFHTNSFSVVVIFKTYLNKTDLGTWPYVLRKGRTELKGFWFVVHRYDQRLAFGTGNGTEFSELWLGDVADKKTHIAIGVVDGNVQKFWLDDLYAERTLDWTPQYSTSDLQINFDCIQAVYLVLVYNRALSDSEIQAIYNDPLNPPQDGVVLFYAPDSVDTANGKWLDKSGNGNDGTIVGASYVPLRPISEALQSEAKVLNIGGTQAGGDSYKLSFSLSTELSDYTIVTITQPWNITSWSSAKWNWWISCSNRTGSIAVEIGHYNSGTFRMKSYYTSTGWWDSTLPKNEKSNTYHVYYGIIDNSHGIIKAGVYDENIVHESTLSQTVRSIYSCKIGPSEITHASIYIYSRALSNDEIKQIYENPLNPPKDGLVLFYSPYSYDPGSGKWLNIAPIFPTVPLVEELDAVNYGATPERVSIPGAHYYDIQNSSEIPVENVSVALLSNNTTTQLLPSFLVLPFNSTVTLNVSATNYLPTLTTFQTPTDVLNIFLVPNKTVVPTKVLGIDLSNATVPEFTPPENATRLYGLFGKWIGGEYITHLFSFDTKGFLEDILNNPPLPGLGIIFLLVIWAGSVLATYAYFRQPEPTLIIGSAVYIGLTEFIDASPAMLAPLGVFSVYLGYQIVLKIMRKLGGGSE